MKSAVYKSAAILISSSMSIAGLCGGNRAEAALYLAQMDNDEARAQAQEAEYRARDAEEQEAKARFEEEQAQKRAEEAQERAQDAADRARDTEAQW